MSNDNIQTIIDKLTIVGLKCWHQEETAHDPNASMEQVAGAKLAINNLNNQRNDLIQEFDVVVTDVLLGKIPPPKVFRQHKQYTPPQLKK
jgi:hypothetical protein